MSECLKCGKKTSNWASLCIHCCADEFKKMDKGEGTMWLYAAQKYEKFKKSEGKKNEG